MPILNLTDFSGGLNLRAAPSELARNETPSCLNVTLDERGGVVKRLGLSRLNSSDGAAGTYQNFYFSPILGYYLVQDGTTVYKTTDFNTLTSLKVFSTSARVGFCDFLNLAIVVHPVDGVFSYDGATFATITTSVKGNCCAPWQNKLWVAGDPAQPARIYFSDPGATTFTVTSTNDLREIDARPITALEATNYLIVFKEASTYRVTDSTTGSYTSISPTAGASGTLASVVLGRTIASMNGSGIWITDGISPPVNVAEKVKPLFSPTRMNYAKLDLIAAGRTQNRMVFSFPYGSAQTTNNRTFEFHPTEGWIVPHTIGVSCFTNLVTGSFKLYGSDSVKKNFYEVFTTGADNGAAITANFQTPWVIPNSDHRSRFIRLQLHKRGAFSLYVKRDYDTGQGQLYQVAAPSSGPLWDSGGNWDGGALWGQTNQEELQELFPYTFAKSVSFNISESSTLNASGVDAFGDGSAPEVGAVALYGIGIEHVMAGVK